MTRRGLRILFSSYHAYPDHTSGAALATRDLFEALTARGWECRAVCGPLFDGPGGRTPAEVLGAHRLPYHVERCAPPGGTRYELFHAVLNGVPVSLYRPETFAPGRPPTRAEGEPFLDVLGRACARFHPDLVLTYGGPPLTQYLMGRAQRAGARVVFCLHNMEYRTPGPLHQADALWVPSAFAQAAYRERVGVEPNAVPWPWARSRAVAPDRAGRYVTLVNPVPAKGAAWFARIVAETARRRPEIPFLAVAGRAGDRAVQLLAAGLAGARNLSIMPATPNPQEFYARSRAVLIPSLVEETFGRVAVEALANGLPVLATRRGALPETLGQAGLLFEVPDHYTAPGRYAETPTPAEVAPWVDALARLWDDDAFYSEHQARALSRAAEWNPDGLCAGAMAFFRSVAGLP